LKGKETMKTYLGDAVYVEFDDDYVKLTTEYGTRVINTVYLEPAVLEEFLAFIHLRLFVGTCRK